MAAPLPTVVPERVFSAAQRKELDELEARIAALDARLHKSGSGGDVDALVDPAALPTQDPLWRVGCRGTDALPRDKAALRLVQYTRKHAPDDVLVFAAHSAKLADADEENSSVCCTQ